MIKKKSRKLLPLEERPAQAASNRPLPAQPSKKKDGSGGSDGGPQQEIYKEINPFQPVDRDRMSLEQRIYERRLAKLGKTAEDMKGIDLDEITREMARQQHRERITRETEKPASDDNRASGSNMASGGSSGGGGHGSGGSKEERLEQRSLPDISSIVRRGQPTEDSDELDVDAP